MAPGDASGSETSLAEELALMAEQTDFSGVALIERDGEPLATIARGYADRANRREISLSTQFATASATKGFTALTVVSLIESGQLELDTPLVSLTGDDLPVVDPAVTIQHLLGHTSGVGDYLDEEVLSDIDDQVLELSAHAYEGPEDFLPMLVQHPQVSPPGERFVYNNGGYMMLALAIERAGGAGYHQLVRERVIEPAGLAATAFLRSDDLPAGCALGYLQNGRTNVFHLPAVGIGDGGAYSTVADLSTFWAALYAGDIVGPPMVELMTSAHQTLESGEQHYGLGFWVETDGRTVSLEGMDAGVSFQSSYRHDDRTTFTVISNTSSGAWPLVKLILERLK